MFLKLKPSIALLFNFDIYIFVLSLFHCLEPDCFYCTCSFDNGIYSMRSYFKNLGDIYIYIISMPIKFD